MLRKKIYNHLLIVLMTMSFGFTAFAQNPTIVGAARACVGEQKTYSIQGPSPNLTYNWTVVVGTITNTTSTTNTESITVAWGVFGGQTVQVEAIDPNTGVVKGVDRFEVGVNHIPDPNITALNSVGCIPNGYDPEPPLEPLEEDEKKCILVCENSTAHFEASGGPGYTFQWSVTGGSIVGSATNSTVTVNWGGNGSGQITLTETNTAGCAKTTQRCIEIIEGPDANFAVMPDVVSSGSTCTERLLSFIDLSTSNPDAPIINWEWDFGDGTYSNDRNPTYTYTSGGNYAITLTVTNECNCTSTFSTEIEVMEGEPLEISCPAVVCENEEVEYTLVTSCPNADWDIIGGQIVSNDPSSTTVTILWDDVDDKGFGYISALDPCNPSCPTSIQVPVILDEGVIEGQTSLCMGENYVYRLPNWPGTDFNWTIDGNADLHTTDQPNERIISPTGGGVATLRCAYNNKLTGCGGKAVIQLNITPRGEIEGEKRACITGSDAYTMVDGYSAAWQTVNPLGTVVHTGNGTSYIPTFPTAGAYLIKSSGAAFCEAEPIEVEVFDLPEPLEEINGPEFVCLNIPYNYNAGLSVAGTNIVWSITGGTFSGGATSTSGEVVSAKFTGSGPYQISARREYQSLEGCLSNPIGIDVRERQITNSIVGENPVCGSTYHDYEATYKTGDLYTWTITPPDLGSVESGDGGSDITVLWNDVTTAQVATLEVKMRVCNTIYTETKQVTVGPIANPSITGPSSVCQGSIATFTINPSLSNFTRVTWDYGDGNTSTSTTNATGEHIYASATPAGQPYSVTVSIEDPNGCVQVATASTTIVVDPAPAVILNQTGTITAAPGTTDWPVDIDIVSPDPLPAGATIEWYKNSVYMGAGYNNNDPLEVDELVQGEGYGRYYAKINYANGCSRRSADLIIETPTTAPCRKRAFVFTQFRLSVTYGNCGNATVNVIFPNGSNGYTNHSWSGNPVGATSQTTASYNIPLGGQQTITYETDFNGCRLFAEFYLDLPFLTNFNFSPSCGTAPNYTVDFTDITSYGTNVNTASLTYEYKIKNQTGTITLHTLNGANHSNFTLSSGTYQVEFNITGTVNGSVRNCTRTKTVTLVPYPSADFTFNFNGACEGFPIQFTNTSTPNDPDAEYFWDFLDGAQNRQENPARVFDYANSSGFNVSLTVTNKFGCSSTSIKNVLVKENTLKGNISASKLVECAGTGVILTYNNASGRPPIDQHLWQPDSFAIITGSANNTTTVLEAGSYFLNMIDADMCFATSDNTIDIEFISIPTPVITGTQVVCEGEDIELFGGVGSGDFDYTWSILSGGGTLDDPVNADLIQATGMGGLPVGSYILQLEVEETSSGSQCTKTSTIDIEVLAPPSKPTVSTNRLTCAPFEVELTASHPNAGTFNWSDGQSGSVVSVNKGGWYACTYTNAAGCSSTEKFWVDKSPEEYIWIYPIGCYELCLSDFENSETFNIPDPIIPFDSWQITPGSNQFSGSNSIPDVELSSNVAGIYLHSFKLQLDGCNITKETLELTVAEECCDLDVEVHSVELLDDNGQCFNLVDGFVVNPNNVPITVSFTSPFGSFVPSTITIPPGGLNFSIRFYPNPGVMANSVVTFKVKSTVSVDPGVSIRCAGESGFQLPADICDASNWRIGNNAQTNVASFSKDGTGLDAPTEEDKLMDLFELAPNPTSSVANITYTLNDWHIEQEAKIVLYSFNGQLIYSEALTEEAGSLTLSTSHLPNGVYMVSLLQEGAVVELRKLVVQH